MNLQKRKSLFSELQGLELRLGDRYWGEMYSIRPMELSLVRLQCFGSAPASLRQPQGCEGPSLRQLSSYLPQGILWSHSVADGSVPIAVQAAVFRFFLTIVTSFCHRCRQWNKVHHVSADPLANQIPTLVRSKAALPHALLTRADFHFKACFGCSKSFYRPKRYSSIGYIVHNGHLPSLSQFLLKGRNMIFCPKGRQRFPKYSGDGLRTGIPNFASAHSSPIGGNIPRRSRMSPTI